MSTLYEGREARIAFAPQTTWDTAIADSGTFVEVFTDTVEVDPAVKVHEIPGATGSKSPVYSSTVVTQAGSMPRFVTRGPFCVRYADYFAICCFQDVTEVATTPFKKVITPFAVSPDFGAAQSDNLPAFATWLKWYPATSTSWKTYNAIVEKFTMSGERGGMVNLECGWVSGIAAAFDANPSGTWERGLDGPGGADDKANAYGILFFDDIALATINLSGAGAVDMVLKSFTFDYTHEVTGEELNGSGGYGNYGIINRAATLELSLLKDSTVESALADWVANGDAEVILRWGTVGLGTDLDTQLTVRGKIASYKPDESGLLGSVLTLNCSAADTSSDMCELVVVNTIDRNYVAP